MSSEKIIVSLTTWKPRIGNIPVVLDTIFDQTKRPDKVVLNLSFDEIIPDDIQDYIDHHNVEIFRVPDTKVYKKLIPTLLRYPDDCIISIDDDFLYPKTMIEDFWETHLRFPDSPISGNAVVLFEMQCHCGCASLTKAEFFGKYLPMIDAALMENCLSDDIVYTFLSTKNKHPYLRTEHQYFENMESYNSVISYTESTLEKKSLTIRMHISRKDLEGFLSMKYTLDIRNMTMRLMLLRISVQFTGWRCVNQPIHTELGVLFFRHFYF